MEEMDVFKINDDDDEPQGYKNISNKNQKRCMMEIHEYETKHDGNSSAWKVSTMGKIYVMEISCHEPKHGRHSSPGNSPLWINI